MNRTPHLDQHYEAELQGLTDHLERAGRRAEAMLRDAVLALLDRDERLARTVIEVDRDLNRLEVEVDKLAVNLLARRSPVGADLRLVTSALKCVIDMERVGDLAVNIAKRSLDLPASGVLPPPAEIPRLAHGTIELFGRAIRSLSERDAVLARTIRTEDRRLDDLNRAVFRRMIDHAKDHPAELEHAFGYTSVSRHLERVGDHAANIAEMVVFLVEGKVLRHAPHEES
jgi:phosphate transport system protein